MTGATVSIGSNSFAVLNKFYRIVRKAAEKVSDKFFCIRFNGVKKTFFLNLLKSFRFNFRNQRLILLKVRVQHIGKWRSSTHR